jgi:hypothetical protein
MPRSRPQLAYLACPFWGTQLERLHQRIQDRKSACITSTMLFNLLLWTLAYTGRSFGTPPGRVPHDTSGVSLYNNCNSTIYSFTVLPGIHTDTSNAVPPGQWYSEPYQYPTTGGVSIKLSRTNRLQVPVTQLEYSFRVTGLWYDLSNIDCGPKSQSFAGPCPFLSGGMFLTLDQPCPTRQCNSSDTNCPEAYNLPSDDWVVRNCVDSSASLILYLCSNTTVP